MPEVSKLKITAGTIRNNRLSLRPAGRDFFPKDAIGGPNRNRCGIPVTLHIRGIGTIQTDLPTDAKTGLLRWFFRDRAWVPDFIRQFELQPGDTVNLVRLDDREYLLDAVPRRLKFIDLFAGIGGIRLAFESTGAECVYSSEWNKYAAQTYTANFNEEPAGDITEVDAADIPDHDILCAGFPCQPFSIAGVSKKNSLGMAHGFDDETQGTLFFDIVRILREKRPRAFMLENVRNLKSHDKGRTYQVIIRNLTALGYKVSDEIIDSRCVVPQKRKRIFIVGTRPGLDFEFPQDDDWDEFRQSSTIGDILEGNVDKKYILTEHLWNYLQNYKKKHAKAGNGFGFGLVKSGDIARTLSARYYKDGSEVLVYRGQKKRPRMLTERECARLMGFPEDFEIPVSKTQAYKQFGNSVVVPVVTGIAHNLVQAIRENKLSSE